MSEVQSGNFREDLYYRLNVFHIEIPPLRERKEDIPLLAEAFATRLAMAMNKPKPTFDDDAVKLLTTHDWPGNVRELTNAIERALVVCEGNIIRGDDFPLTSHGHTGNGYGARSLAQLEKEHIQKILEECDWNISQASRILEVDRTTVYNKMKLYGLKRG